MSGLCAGDCALICRATHSDDNAAKADKDCSSDRWPEFSSTHALYIDHN